MRQFLVSICTAGLALIGAQASAYEAPFPRTGGINMASPSNYDDPAYQKALGQLDLMILTTYPGRASWNTAIEAIKKINPNALVFMYVNSNELGEPVVLGSGKAWDEYRAKLDSMKWWLYASGGNGSRVQSSYGPNYYVVNNTPYTPRDSSGYTSMEWITKFFVDNYYKKNDKIDGFFMDNTFWKPTVDGDWDRDGKLDSKSDAAAATHLRQGYAVYYSSVRKLMPGKFQIGNIGSIGEAAAIFPEYKGLFNGGVIEAVIGKSWSVESYAGWDSMMGRYRKVMKNVIAPKLVVFNQWGDPKDYRAARYGITSCLMDDGYHSFTDTSKGYTGVVWFDEYNAKLGMAISEPPTKAWQSGVYRRDFQGGIALVNPKGNGAKTVTLDDDFIALKGTQDPTVNNGQTVRKVTLQDRDGIILMRKTPITRPLPPIIAKH
jgi:hypothetical protein